MDAFRLELVIGFALLLLVGVPAVVVRLLDRPSRGTPPGPPPGPGAVSVKPGESAAGRVCPYCKDAVPEDAVYIECKTCGTWHHATCFEENQGCAVFGCKEKRGVGRAERA